VSKLILASASPRREELLMMLGLNFTTVPSKIEEESYHEAQPPEELVQELARKKVEEVAGLVEDTVIIGADTVLIFNGRILGKPRDQEEACETLTELQGKRHTVFTGIAVYGTINDKLLLDYNRTEVYLRKMDEFEISAYVKTGEPLDKAGAYGIQGIGGVFVEKIEGSYYNVVGLPIDKLVLMLKEFGFNIF